MVQADNNTLFSGSFYSNSSLTGNWSDFEARELVEYMDKNFRTIATRDARGIGGHSMGGYGVLKIAMMYPDVFSSAYAMSPGLLTFVKEFGPNSDSYKQLAAIKTKEELDKTYYPRVIAACARAWSPNENKPPFYFDLPFNYIGDSLVVDTAVYAKWRANMPFYMIDKYASNLKQLKAIKLDWGEMMRRVLLCSAACSARNWRIMASNITPRSTSAHTATKYGQQMGVYSMKCFLSSTTI